MNDHDRKRRPVDDSGVVQRAAGPGQADPGRRQRRRDARAAGPTRKGGFVPNGVARLDTTKVEALK
jgi:hypothetical protein